MTTLIMKFGGTTVSTTMALTQMLSIVMQERERWDEVVLVVSALEGVTDALIEAAQLAMLGNKRGYRRIVATLRTRHLTLVEQLPLGPIERAALQADIDRLLFDMLGTCQLLTQTAHDQIQPESLDSVIGVGERLAARMVAALLRQNKIRSVALDATEMVVTDEVFGNATINIPATRVRVTEQMPPMLERDIIPVLTGYIGSTVAGKPTTLGRGGSEYTAAVLALCLGADQVWMWTDVDGMMTADPRDIAAARPIPSLSYDEAAELALFGARLLHPRTIDPLREQNIPLRVRNVYKPQADGTRIDSSSPAQSLKAVTTIQGLGITALNSEPVAAIFGRVNDLLVNSTGSQIDVMIAAQSPRRSFVCFVIPTTAGPDAVHTLKLALDGALRHEQAAPNWHIQPVTVITAIGARLDLAHRLSAQFIEALDGTRSLALAQGASNCSVSIVIDPDDADQTLQRAHDQIILNSG